MDFGPADLFMKPIVQSQQFFFVYLYKHEGGKFNLGNHCKRELSTKSEGDGGGVVTAHLHIESHRWIFLPADIFCQFWSKHVFLSQIMMLS